ncbi:hypothetical protein [Vibrio sp. H11]|uniref:hypothetical protein n=1 Tax=Vibrio sp. H11 TaxID=2565928 RepID=UPI0010A5F7B5|nr:hypothetical protein [Vibrio sp. H11]
MKKLLLPLLTVLVASGCSTVPVLTQDSPELQTTQSFSAVDDKAVIYLYRDREANFGLFELEIHIDDEDVNTYPACYRRFELEPGNYFFEADHPDVFGFEDEMNFTAKAGEVSYFEYLPIARFGIPGETKIVAKTAEETQQLIREQDLCVNPIVQLKARD